MWASKATRSSLQRSGFSGSGNILAMARRSPGLKSLTRCHPDDVNSRCFSVARSLRPLASAISNTGFWPTLQTASDLACARRPSGFIEMTVGAWPTKSRIGVRLPSARHTRVSPVTHSRRSDICGFFPSRCSTARFNCERAITGTASSFARILSPREISPISVARFSLVPGTCISCR